NSVARLQNSSFATSPDAALTALHTIEINQPIDGFPVTPREVDRLSSVESHSILRALGLGSTGTLESRRQRVRMQLGLKAIPV
ncbi:hypothetical protein K432DRAFT_312332, partial [Lepidopterella palustris CBS 459.81]